MYQSSFSVLILNGFKHIGMIPPFPLNVLLWPSLRHRRADSHWPIGTISQTSLNALLHNGLRHIGAIPPFITALLQTILIHRWALFFNFFISSHYLNCFWGSILSTTQQFLNSLPSPPSITICLCRPFFTALGFSSILSLNCFGTCRHFSSWLASHEFILTRFPILLPWRGKCSLFSDTPPCDAPTRCLASP